MRQDNPSETEEPVKKQCKSVQNMERMLKAFSVIAKRSIKHQKHRLNTVTEGEASVQDARQEHDALLTEMSQDFDQDMDISPNTNQQLADIINKNCSPKFSEPKMKDKTKEKMEQ